MFGYFYNSSIKKYIIIMGQLFNGIQVARKRGDIISYKKVPITYASKERFAIKLNSINSNVDEHGIARIEQVLPRMNLSLVDMIYNPLFKTFIGSKKIGRYNPVPYKFMFEMQIATRYEDDMLQIVEQILPYFQPNFTSRISELYENESSYIDRDIQITLQSISISEDLEGSSTERRRLQWDLVFELDGWVYPPTKDEGQIKTVYLDFHANKRELTNDNNFESIDTMADDNGDILTGQSENIPIPIEPTPPRIRENE